MLENINLNNKDYNEIIDKAKEIIPIFSKEWTDYNNSDPGITILQTLAAVKWMQQEYVNTINDKVRINLLKLIGYTKKPVESPSVVAFIKTPKNQVIKRNTKFYVDNTDKNALIYEPKEDIYVANNSIRNIISVTENRIYNITLILVNGTGNNFAKIFPTDAEKQELYISFEKALQPNVAASLYFDIISNTKNVDNFSGLKLCEIVWEFYSANKWKPMYVEDKTFSFAKSGYIKFKISDQMCLFAEPKMPRGFYIRARVVEERFDVAPKIKRIIFNAFSLFGEDTKAQSIYEKGDGTGEQTIVLNSELAYSKNILVFCKENEEYQAYKVIETKDKKETGRYCILSEQNENICITFSKEKFGYAPKVKGTDIKVVIYDDSKIPIVGKVYGYDEQRIEYDFKNIMEQNFELMLKLENGSFIECKAASEQAEEADLEYSLDYKNGVIIIHNNINCSGELFITSCVICKGKAGNIKSGRSFKLNGSSKERYGEIVAQNIEDSLNGQDREEVEDTLKRAVYDMESVHVAVTGKDYIELLKRVPEIAIDKASVITTQKNGEIKIVIKIKSDEKRPVLSEKHQKIFSYYIEKYRPIATKISFISPKYVPINISGKIIVKAGFKDAKQLIYNKLKEELDGTEGNSGFGKGIVYGEIYSKLENLDCVEYVESLEFNSDSVYANRDISTLGVHKDINDNLNIPEFALSYLNNVDIEINNMTTVM